MKPLLTVCLIFLFAQTLWAQEEQSDSKHIQIEFNEKGQLISPPPDVITNHTSVHVVVKISEDTREKEAIAFFNRYMQVLKVLNDKDKITKQSKVLSSLGLGSVLNGETTVQFTEQLYAKELKRFLKDPNLKKIIADQMDLDSFQNFLDSVSTQAIDGTAGLENLIKIPPYDSLIYPSFSFVIRIENTNGLPLNSPCDLTVKLKKDDCDCGLEFSGDLKFDQFKQGPVKFDYELRMSDNFVDQINLGVPPYYSFLRELSGIKGKSLASQLSDLFNFDNLIKDKNLGFTQDNATAFKQFAAGISKGTTGEADAKKLEAGLNDQKVKGIISNVKTLANKLRPLTTDTALSFLMQYSWVTQAKPISANPVSASGSADSLKKLKDLNTRLTKFKKDSTDIVKQLTLLENTSKASSVVTCCDSAASKGLLNNYKTTQAALRTVSDNIDTVKKQIKELNKNISGSSLAKQAGKSTLSQDSLLYTGFVYVNKEDWGWLVGFGEGLRPTLAYYAFMHHHDALDDYQLTGRAPVRGINEKQRMYILVENSTSKAKYNLKTAITDITSDVDVLGSELTSPKQSTGSGSTKADTSTKAIKPPLKPEPDPLLQAAKTYNTFVPVMSVVDSLAKPYQNGVPKLPIVGTKDKTPDYVTKLVPHERPFKAPVSVSYQILDSAKKNVNSEGTTYSYRVNKLYRFRIKAGLAYSTFEGRTYTINSTENTASYVNNWTGLAPDVGVQIFTAPLDIQSRKLFPHGFPPFLYVGYLFNGAPGDNILAGGGWEIFSGVAIMGGAHFGQSQRLELTEGTLQTQTYYKTGTFISISIGLEAFNALFNTAKPTTNPFKAP